MQRHETNHGRVRKEITATTRALQAADAVAERAMEPFEWERKGLLGRLVRTRRTEQLVARRDPIRANAA